MKISICVLLIGAFTQCKATRCSVCTHSYSSEECTAQGVKQCNRNEDMCESVQRPDNGRMVYIKQCKSSVACNNNPTDHKKEVCCCKGDLCNFSHDECNGAPPPACNVSSATPENGKLRCVSTNEEGEAKIGSLCRFTCGAGFNRRGPRFAKCVREDSGEVEFNIKQDKLPKCEPDQPRTDAQKDLVTTTPPPLKLPKTCKPRYMSFGMTVCMTAKAEILKGNKEMPIGAKCVYRCCRGFMLIGPDEATCVFDKKEGAHLDNPAPKCVKRPGLKINRQIQY